MVGVAVDTTSTLSHSAVARETSKWEFLEGKADGDRAVNNNEAVC